MKTIFLCEYLQKELAKLLRTERPDYAYLKSVFRELRKELSIEVERSSPRLPEIPTEEEMRAFYQQVWQARKFTDMVLIKTLFYTGVRVSELVNIRLIDVDLERCQIRINEGKGGKDRLVPFPHAFRELLGLHIQQMQQKQACYLFESVRKHKYSDRGVRRMPSQSMSRPCSAFRFHNGARLAPARFCRE